MSKPTKNWEFYFELKDGSRTYFEQECKEPTRTKLWRNLNESLMEEEVSVIGFGVKPRVIHISSEEYLDEFEINID